MQTISLTRTIIVAAVLGALVSAAPAPAAEPDWKAVEQALGRTGQLMPGDVYRIGMPRAGAWRELINTDLAVYGGSGVANGPLQTRPVSAHGRDCSLELIVPPLGTLMLVPA